jgi:hypothetical protein
LSFGIALISGTLEDLRETGEGSPAQKQKSWRRTHRRRQSWA